MEKRLRFSALSRIISFGKRAPNRGARLLQHDAGGGTGWHKLVHSFLI